MAQLSHKTSYIWLIDSVDNGSGGGGPREDRTPNPLIKSQLLCQLSYRPAMFLPDPAQNLNHP